MPSVASLLLSPHVLYGKSTEVVVKTDLVMKAILTDHEQAGALFVVSRTLSAGVVLCCRRSLKLGDDLLRRYWRSRCLLQLALLKDLAFESLLLQL